MLDSTFPDAVVEPQVAVASRIHLASPADVPFIVEAIVAEAALGHFGCDCTRPEVVEGLWHQIQAIVSEGVTPLPNARNGAGGRAFVIQVGEANAGFAILAEDMPGSWASSLELFALSVHPAFRGRGLAKRLVVDLVRESRSAHVYARCAVGSTGMIAMLKSLGFALGARSAAGSLTLEWRAGA